MPDVLRSYLKELIEEAYLAEDLVDLTITLRVRTSQASDPQIVDIMTNIRVIRGVAIVRQTMPIRRVAGARDVLQLGIKVMPYGRDVDTLVTTLGKQIKSVPGVEIVKFERVGDQQLVDPTGNPYVY